MSKVHDGNPPPLHKPELPAVQRSTHPAPGAHALRELAGAVVFPFGRRRRGAGASSPWDAKCGGFTRTTSPVKAPGLDDHPEVVKLRELSLWSEAHVWSCPEMHGTITGVFKNQIDWIPLSMGAVRPTQGRTLAVMQVSGGKPVLQHGEHVAGAGPVDADAHDPKPVQRGQGLSGVPRGRPHEGLALPRPHHRRDGRAVQIHPPHARRGVSSWWTGTANGGRWQLRSSTSACSRRLATPPHASSRPRNWPRLRGGLRGQPSSATPCRAAPR